MVKLFIIVNVDWFFLSHRKDIALSAQKNGYDVTIVTKDTGKKTDIKALGLKIGIFDGYGVHRRIGDGAGEALGGVVAAGCQAAQGDGRDHDFHAFHRSYGVLKV